ncbi:MAG TPA: zf-HC2 domain-containing protein [Trebonia sp.]|nr:zf-HC2 domain-containing protein [Trebonia sp.]
MECDRAREAVSAQIDGADSGVPDGALAAHVSGCADCRAWAQRAHVVTRRARLGGAFLDHDLTARVLAAVPPAPARRTRTATQRTALVAVAALQIAITVPLLIFGHDRDAGAHAAHELGSFDLALAIAFCVGAIRPTLSAGLAWPCGIAAGGLVGTAIIDMIGGQTFGIDEAQHLIALAGALLLIWQARTVARPAAGPASAAPAGQAGPYPAAVPPTGFPLVAARSFPFGGDAAQADGPEIARSAAATPPGDNPASVPATGTERARPPAHTADPREAVA